MPDRSALTYFGAGPALLPTSVLETAAQSLVNHDDTGLGLAEHSHRSKLASGIVETTKQNLAKCLDVPDDYEVLFMQGGGSGQFSATVYNLVGVWVERQRQAILKELGGNGEGKEEEVMERLRKAVDEEFMIDYLVTGSWSLKASQEAARLVGAEHVNVAADARKINDGKFGKIPEEKDWKLSKSPAMVYYCDNETVDGVEFPGFPKILEPTEGNEPIVVADMSSNILSRSIPIRNYSVIFFGAQKNLGSTGITVVIIKKNLLPPTVTTPAPSLLRKLGLPVGPVVLSYDTIAKNKSLYNTLSIFDVFIAGEVLKLALSKWPTKTAENQGQLSGEKAELIYKALDSSPETYTVVPDKTARSRMNICFRVKGGDAAAEEEFLKLGKEKWGLDGLKGHRSVGGIRASNYNSISLEGAQKLASFIGEYAGKP